MSCLNIFKNYLVFKDKKIQEFLTLNIANVRAIEYFSRCFDLNHNDFKIDGRMVNSILQLRTIALSVLSKIAINSGIIGEITFLGTFERIIDIYSFTFKNQ